MIAPSNWEMALVLASSFSTVLAPQNHDSTDAKLKTHTHTHSIASMYPLTMTDMKPFTQLQAQATVPYLDDFFAPCSVNDDAILNGQLVVGQGTHHPLPQEQFSSCITRAKTEFNR